MKFNYKGESVTLQFDDHAIEAEMKANNNFYEHWLLEWIGKNVKRGGTWIDAGANFGNHTVYFDKFTTADFVLAFEPILTNYDLLVKNLRKNNCKRTIPIQQGLSNEKGQKAFIQGKRPSQCELVDGFGIEVTTIDEFTDKEISVIKIDVEGYEIQVIQGAIKAITKNKPEIFVEIWGDRKPIEDILLPLGYELKERYCHAPVYHYSCGNYPVTFKEPK